jgi:geranylgeranyl pyrophosphate synthase
MAVELPNMESVREMLDLRWAGTEPVGRPVLSRYLGQSLLIPLSDFLGRSGKQLRARLVDLGASTFEDPSVPRSAERIEQLRIVSAALESVHAGSMVIDDIEDESLLRRGEPTLHRRFGLAKALNAGNWLYFLPLEQIRQMHLPADLENTVFRLFHTSLLRAHFGQALDVGVRMDEVPADEVGSLCMASMELKSGALTELAVAAGASLSAPAGVPDWVSGFGRAYGVALQMFDDIGNLNPPGAMSVKRFEDLFLRRPSWIWCVAAREFSPETYQSFLSSVRALPHVELLEALLQRTGLAALAKTQARAFLKTAVDSFVSNSQLLPASRDQARALEQTLVVAYD